MAATVACSFQPEQQLFARRTQGNSFVSCLSPKGQEDAFRLHVSSLGTHSGCTRTTPATLMAFVPSGVSVNFRESSQAVAAWPDARLTTWTIQQIVDHDDCRRQITATRASA